MANTAIKHDGTSVAITVSGTPGLYLFGPPKNREMYNGDAQGLYQITTGAQGTNGTYRWIVDMRRASGSGPRTGYSAT